MIMRLALAGLFVALVAGCREEAVVETPAPVAMTRDALGHYCQMDVMEHDGPKAQVHVAGLGQPLWFSQVRDAIAFTRLPEETGDVLVVYVSDMAKAPGWSDPGAENWIDASAAHFVIKSRRTGGMGAPEVTPFGDRAAAEAFVAKHGGQVVTLREVPDAYVLGPVDISAATPYPEASLQ